MDLAGEVADAFRGVEGALAGVEGAQSGEGLGLDDSDPMRGGQAELRAERDRLEAQLDTVEAEAAEAPNPELLAHLPVGNLALADIPDNVSRRLFDALRLEIHYDYQERTAICRVTLTGTRSQQHKRPPTTC